MLHNLYVFGTNVTKAYEDYAFNRGTRRTYHMRRKSAHWWLLALHHILHFTTNDLSAFYFDIIKDRLYNDHRTSLSRRTAQTVLYEILKAYTTVLAPVACHTAEEIYENYRDITPQPLSSVFKQGWLAMVSY